MSRGVNGPEAYGEALHYPWEDPNSTGYHINGAKAAVLERRVLPSLNTLPSGSLVADYGCGEGRVRDKAPHHTLRPYTLRGFELNDQAVIRYNEGSKNGPDRAEVADLTQLTIGSDRFDAGLFWRVLHSIPPQLHETVLGQIAATLKPGAPLHVAVRSERDWVAEDLKRKGLYQEGRVNDSYLPMKEALDPEGITKWPLYFFQPGELVRLGGKAGLEVVHQAAMREASGYKILAQTRPQLSYDYVEFKKPKLV